MEDYDLKIALTKLGNKRLNFGFYRGADANQVLISPRPPTSKQVAEMEKECGDTKRILKGIVFYEGNLLVFATKTEPSAQWEMQMTKVFKERKCSTFLPLSLRKLSENESDEVEAEEGEGEESPTTPPPPQTSTAPPPDLSPAWLQLKAALTPQIKAVAA